MLRRNEGTCPSSPSDDEVGELEGAIRAERAKRAEQSNWSSQGERVVEAGVAGGQHSASDNPGHVLINSDDFGRGKGRDRQPVGNALFDRRHQVRAQSSQVAAQDDSVRIDNCDYVVNGVAQCTACALEHLQHRGVAFLYGLNDFPNRFLRSFVDQPGRLLSGQQVPDSQQVLRPDQGLQAAIATAVAGRS